MVSPVSQVPSTRIKGLMNTFDNFYTNHAAENPTRAVIMKLMEVVASKNNARDETFNMLGDPPPFERWDEDAPRYFGTIGDQSWTVPVLKWQNGVRWKRIDEEDDLTGRLKPALSAAARKAALLEVDIFFQLLQSSVNGRLLPGIPTCADGLPLFSASRTLMGSGGNIVAGSGVRSIHQIQADFYEVLEQLQGVRDTHGDYYWSEGEIDGPKIIFASTANRQRFIEAFEQKTMPSMGAGVDNVLVAKGNVTLVFTPRITGNSWYIGLENVPRKPIFTLTRTDVGGIEKLYKDETNSDESEASDTRRIVFRKRAGYGYSLPLGLFQVSNS